MIAAHLPVQRATDAKLLVVDRDGRVMHRSRGEFVDTLHTGDLVIANDAATLPASLSGYHLPSSRRIEVRLAGRDSLAVDSVRRFTAVLFGDGDFRTPTENRPLPPPVHVGDRVGLGPLRATIIEVLWPQSRLIRLEFEGSPREIWEGLAVHGRPIQYAHIATPIALWDTWTRFAGPPAAFEPPSAGFVLDWNTLASMATRGIQFGTLTHAAGVSSTGDPQLDALLPFDEPYEIPPRTADLIARALSHRARIVAIGTTVVRALEHAAAADGTVRAGEGLASQRIGPGTRLRIVDAILTGTHEPGTSHHELLRAFVAEDVLTRMDRELTAHGYRTHEFGDSILAERRRPVTSL